MEQNWRHDMAEVLDERFSSAQSLQDLIKKAGSDTTIILTLKEIEDIIKAMNVIQQSAALLPSAPESDVKDEQNMIYSQLDTVYQILTKKQKSESIV